MSKMLANTTYTRKEILIPFATVICLALVTFLGVYVNRLPIFFAGLLGFSFGIAMLFWASQAAWRPATLLLALGPFQAIISGYFGVLANILTLIIIACFFIQINRERIVQLLFATKVQLWTSVFILSLLIGVALSFQYQVNYLYIVDYGQKVMLFLLISVMFIPFIDRDSAHIPILAFVFSMTIYCLLSVIEFYFGYTFLPYIGEARNQFVDPTYRASLDLTRINHYRLQGLAGTMSINRLGMWAGIAFLFAFGGLFAIEDKKYRPFLMVVSVVLAMSVLATASRSSILGLIAGVIILLMNRKSGLKTMLFLVVGLGLGIILFLSFLPVELLSERFTVSQFQSTGGRSMTWAFAWDLFLSNPLFGVGNSGFFNHFVDSGLYLLYPDAADSHNAYMDLLAENGLFATIPFVILFSIVINRFVQDIRSDTKPATWARTSLAALAFVAISIIFHSFQYERPVWLIVAMAAALEYKHVQSLKKNEFRPLASGTGQKISVSKFS